jgi:hypothetical protein
VATAAHRSPPGSDLEESALRLSNHLHVLRELVHLTSGWLASERRLEFKCTLADHLHDDARSIAKLRRRLVELGVPAGHPGAPGPELAVLLDAVAGAPTAAAYADVAYGVLKPRLIATLRLHLDALDALLEEPTQRLLTQLVLRQERHVAELSPASSPDAPDTPADLGAVPILRGEARSPRFLPAPAEPARDVYVVVAPEGDPLAAGPIELADLPGRMPAEPDAQRHVAHALLDSELCVAELAGRTSHEHPELPWETHVALARRCWDAARHAEVLDRLMVEELGGRWGDRPVSAATFRSGIALELPERLARLRGSARPLAAWRASERRQALLVAGQETLARTVDQLLADDLAHVPDPARPGTHPTSPA